VTEILGGRKTEPGTRLVDVKLTVPPLRSDFVSRSELIDKARVAGSRAVAVTAPAGYGKSTLLVEWAHTEDRAVAWVSLDRFDDDPATLLTLIASAFSQATGTDPALVADMLGPGVAMLGRSAPRLATALRRSPMPFVIVLDDLQEIRTPACHDVLGLVMAGIPDGSQLVAASRAEQPHIPRMRASADTTEILACDLALDSAGAEKIFAAAQVPVSREVAEAVARRTEGWAAGIYLASLITRESGEAEAPVTGDDRYVADYLQREALHQLPERLQRFLRRTSVLDDLCASLCEAVLEEPGAQDLLQELEASNHFLVALDRRREWFRYHALFREFLAADLARAEPGEVMKLHLRAADWYEADGSPERALEHLLCTTELERCVQLVTRLALPTYRAGRLSTLQRWMEAVGPIAIEQYPPLAVVAGYIAALSGRPAEAMRWLAVVDEATFDVVPLDGSASFESARAMFRGMVCPEGVAQMIVDASFALAREPEWSPWRTNPRRGGAAAGGQLGTRSGPVR
jgi:LuxR family maltose regulon positive regulatory protein